MLAATIPAQSAQAAAERSCRAMRTTAQDGVRVRVTFFNVTATCTRARVVARAFLAGPRTLHNPNATRSRQYFTMSRAPGWRCGTGAGAGTYISAGCRNPATQQYVGFDAFK